MYNPMNDTRLLDIESYKGRLLAFLTMDSMQDFQGLKVLVPGSALGGECLAALELGAQEVTGLEVSSELVKESQNLVENLSIKNLSFMEFDGRIFPENGFDLVLSGHVIEHTPDWKEHLRQCVIATRPSGKVYLEFPTRYYKTELHTGLISFEWLPYIPRSIFNYLSVFLYQCFGMKKKSILRLSIQKTLQQVSTRQINRYLYSTYQGRMAIKSVATPSPGIVRLIIY
jgi:SAM-dependent methyltransferase